MKEELHEALSQLARALWPSKTITLTPVLHNGTNYLRLTAPPIADYIPDGKPEVYVEAVKEFREAFEKDPFFGKSLSDDLISLTPVGSKVHLLFNVDGMIKEKEKLSQVIEIKSIMPLPSSTSTQNQDSQRIEELPGVPESERGNVKYIPETSYLLNSFLKAVQKQAAVTEMASLKQASLGYYDGGDNQGNQDWVSLAPVVTKTEKDELDDIFISHVQDEFGIERTIAGAMVKWWESGSRPGFYRFAIKVSEFQKKLDPKTGKPLPPPKESKYLPKEQKTSEEQKISKKFTPFVKKTNIQVAKDFDQKSIAVTLEPDFGMTGNFPEVHIILVIDSSGSMAGGVFKKVQEEINRFLTQLSTDTNKDSVNISLITFNNTANTVFANQQIKTEENLNKLKKLIDDIRATGTTDICAGLGKAIELCKNKNNRLIFITDGEQSIKKENFKFNLEKIFAELDLELIPSLGLIGFSTSVSLADLNLIREVFTKKPEELCHLIILQNSMGCLIF